MNVRARLRAALNRALYATAKLILTPVAWLFGLDVGTFLSQAALIWLPSDYDAPSDRLVGARRYRPRRRIAAHAHA